MMFSAVQFAMLFPIPLAKQQVGSRLQELTGRFHMLSLQIIRIRIFALSQFALFIIQI